MFVRTESFSQFIRLYPVISFIVALNVVVYLLCSFPLFPNEEIIVRLIAYNLFIYEGEWYRFLTAIFTHVSFTHVLFNCFSLIIFGPILERMLGKGKFIFIYLSTGILANIATYYIQPLHYSHLGASGAIFGLFGVYLFILLYRKHLLTQMNKQTIQIIIVFSLIMTFVQPRINITAHLVGLLAGLILANLVIPKRKNYYY